MLELQSILRAWRDNPQAPGVLATVVHVQGSAYRRPGARMWIGENGQSRIGTISGGCLEGDVVRKSPWWTADGRPSVRIYDSTSDDDVAGAFGLGCNGVIYLLLERTEWPATQRTLQYLDDCAQTRTVAAMATVVRTQPGSPYQVGEHFLGLDSFPPELAAHAGRTCLLQTADADFFVEFIAPPQRLLVLGGGHDVLPVLKLAENLGWESVVADVRSGYTKPDRYAGAKSFIALPPTGPCNQLPIDADTVVVMMTHNFLLDLRLLPHVVEKQPRYLGILGPWSRTQKLFQQTGLVPKGINLHAPIGLDLGGDTPDSIALAIVAEIQAHLHGRTGGTLRAHRDAIHDQVLTLGQSLTNCESPAAEPAYCERN